MGVFFKIEMSVKIKIVGGRNMELSQFESYLNIDSSRYNNIDKASLDYFMERYMMTVPFENINVQNQVPISVNTDDLLDKVINQHRGGFCYEMNHLFGTYLEKKGFAVHRASGTVHTPDGGVALEGSHMSLYTILNDTYYVTDVGFGDLPLHAIPISHPSQPVSISDINGEFRAIFDKEDCYHVQKLKNNKWTTLYHAYLEPQSIQDFSDKIIYNESNPNSIFVKQLLITQPQSFGRATMTHQSLTLTSQSSKEKYKVSSHNYKHFLKKYFNLNITIDRLEQ